MKRKTALALCLLLLTSLVFTACGNGEKPAVTAVATADVTEDQTDPNDVYDVEIRDLRGHDFAFLTQESDYDHLRANEIYSEGLNGDKVNDAVFARNAAFEKDYNCTISESRTSSVLNTAREPLIAGEYVYDVLYGRTTHLRTLSASGVMVDFTTLKNIQLEKNWWDHNLHEGLGIAGHLFYVTGEISTVDDRSANVLYYNQDLIEKNRLQDPTELALAGTWTVERLYEMSEACIADLDGDGVWTPGQDIFAWQGPDGCNTCMIAAAHLYLGNRNNDGTFSLPATVRDDILDAWAKLKPLLTTPHRDVSDHGAYFRTGKAGFYAMNFASIAYYSTYDLNFGVLPLPKLNEEQEEYWTNVSNVTNFTFGIPVTVDLMQDAAAAGFESGREMVAYFLNALCYRSRDTVTPAFFDQVVKHQLVRDEKTVIMLDLALKNKLYDPIIFFNFGSIGDIFKKAGSNGSGKGFVGSGVNYDTLVSLYESRLAAARKALKNYLNYLDQFDEENANA